MIDIVILSNAKDESLKSITNDCLNSIHKNTKKCNIIVVEQNKYIHWNKANLVMNVNEKFNYNRFANLGAKEGFNEWICIANNDLIFTPNWLDELLKIDNPVLSPHCPDDKRQQNINGFEKGVQVGRHLSGWCFVVKRKVWEKIGGFDEDFSFWCADNSFVEQLIKIGIEPVVVEKSIVYHLGSKTLKTVNNRDELTKQQVIKFNRKYDKNLFGYGK
jgi:GT2 family glycosyltransferase